MKKIVVVEYGVNFVNFTNVTVCGWSVFQMCLFMSVSFKFAKLNQPVFPIWK